MCHQYLKQRTWGMHTFTSPSETCHRDYRALYIPVSRVACRMSSKILDHNSDWRPREYTGPNRQNRGDLRIWLKSCTNNPIFHQVWRRSRKRAETYLFWVQTEKFKLSECLNFLLFRGRETILNLSSSLKETTSIWPKVGKNIELVDHKIIILLVSKFSVWPDSSPIFSFSMGSSTAHPC